MEKKSSFCLYMPPLTNIGSYKEMVDYAVAHGIDKLETLNILDLSTPDLDVARELKDYADSKGVSFPCVSGKKPSKPQSAMRMLRRSWEVLSCTIPAR